MNNKKPYKQAIEELTLMLMYLTESGRISEQELLEEYGLSEKALNERFEFRNIFPKYRGQGLAK